MTTQEEFVKRLYPIIKRECEARGYKYPVAIVAQAAKESAWGRSRLSDSYYNFFGMKAGSHWDGFKVNMKTKEEYVKGQLTEITDAFRVYSSVEEGVRGYFEFISTKRYENLKSATSEINFFELLRDDGYFTSSSYVESIKTYLNICHMIIDGEAKEQTTPEKPVYVGILGILDDMAEYIAGEVIYKKYGNGEDRKRALGIYYQIIQDKVNRRLKDGE